MIELNHKDYTPEKVSRLNTDLLVDTYFMILEFMDGLIDLKATIGSEIIKRSEEQGFKKLGNSLGDELTVQRTVRKEFPEHFMRKISAAKKVLIANGDYVEVPSEPFIRANRV